MSCWLRVVFLRHLQSPETWRATWNDLELHEPAGDWILNLGWWWLQCMKQEEGSEPGEKQKREEFENGSYVSVPSC